MEKVYLCGLGLLRDVVRRGPRPARLVEATERDGLHPLVTPIYQSHDGVRVVGLLWRGPRDGEPLAVETSRASDWTAHTLRLLGPVRSLAIRLVAEAHCANAPAAAELVELAARAAIDEPARADAADSAALERRLGLRADRPDRATLFDPADPLLAKLGLQRYLLLRVAGFADTWTALAEAHLERGDASAALIAAERGTECNPGWGCTLWAQSRIAARLGRAEEARDLAMAALLEPLDTLGVEVRAAREAAAIPAGVSVVEHRARIERQRVVNGRTQPEQQAPTAAEAAARRASDALDAAAEAAAGWRAFDAAALSEHYDVAGEAVLAGVVRGQVASVLLDAKELREPARE